MGGTERKGGGDSNIVEIIALFLAGKLDPESFSENDIAVRSYYLGLMAEDTRFAARVNARKEEILESDRRKNEVGRKIPLFSDSELEAARHHRKRRSRRQEIAGQPRLIPDEPVDFQSGTLDVTDPEKGIAKLHRAFQSTFDWERREIMDEETRFKRNVLREEIGLPIAKGKDLHRNDRYYKFLVNHVVRGDEFGIFGQYYSVMGEIPQELGERISDVRSIIYGLLEMNTGIKEKFRRYDDLKDEYQKKWNNIEDQA